MDRYRAFALSGIPETISAARSELGAAAEIVLKHSWPVSSESPAIAKVGHLEGEVVVLAELPDERVFTDAERDNQRLWELGDAFEMFFQAQGRDDYFEFHIAPNGRALQLRIPSAATFDRSAFESYVLPPGSFACAAELSQGGWKVLARIPAELVQGSRDLAGRIWKYSLCRYDASGPNDEPRLSSSSSYAELDFHRIQDWMELEFDVP